MSHPRILGRRAIIAAGTGLACTAIGTARAATATPLRDLYDEAGSAPSPLAKRFGGSRVTLTGLVAPVPTAAPGWLALGEAALVPCQLCGGAHDWPIGVVAVHAPGLPHIADPYTRVTLTGVLDLSESARAPTGLPDRLVLRDAGLASA
jgi:hypothetical protein